jgi:PAS domain S-box-containing protein
MAASTARTILIVDDDEGLARLIERAVRREGHATAVVGSGEAALSWLRQHRADLMLLDLKLPDLHGHEVIARLGEISCSVPFIIISGQGDEQVAVEMMKQGALDYLVKDVQFLEFVPIVISRSLAQLENRRKLREAEDAFMREHLFGNAVLDATGAVMIVFDHKGRIVRTNRAFERASGFSSDEVRGQIRWPWFARPGGQHALQPVFAQVVADARPCELDGVLVTREGEHRAMAWSLAALHDDAAQMAFVIVSGIDITERRQLQQEVLEISEREKRRIGHDIHDGLGQVLTGVDMLIRVLQKRLAESSPGDADAIGNISHYMQDAIKQARMLAQGLSPVEIEADGLMHGLRELARNTSSLFKVRCDFVSESPVLMDDHAMAVQIYRIAQEAISNAVKHGKATYVVLSLTPKGERQIELQVLDDGIGIPGNGTRSGGMGLRSMRYRADMIGAKLEIRPSLPRGTQVICVFPLSPPEQASRTEAAEVRAGND